MNVFQLAFMIFIITNPIGNCPAVIALIKDHSVREQQKILLRECIFALILAIFFLVLGETFLQGLQIKDYALSISGGVLVFLIALKMIFSVKTDGTVDKPKHDPYIVPIATPLLSGAGLLTMIMLFSKQVQNDWIVFFAILIAWVGVTIVMVLAPYLQVVLGKRGLAALEQLMGLFLAMMAVGMMVKGTSLFLNALGIS